MLQYFEQIITVVHRQMCRIRVIWRLRTASSDYLGETFSVGLCQAERSTFGRGRLQIVQVVGLGLKPYQYLAHEVQRAHGKRLAVWICNTDSK